MGPCFYQLAALCCWMFMESSSFKLKSQWVLIMSNPGEIQTFVPETLPRTLSATVLCTGSFTGRRLCSDRSSCSHGALSLCEASFSHNLLYYCCLSSGWIFSHAIPLPLRVQSGWHSEETVFTLLASASWVYLLEQVTRTVRRCLTVSRAPGMERCFHDRSLCCCTLLLFWQLADFCLCCWWETMLTCELNLKSSISWIIVGVAFTSLVVFVRVLKGTDCSAAFTSFSRL